MSHWFEEKLDLHLGRALKIRTRSLIESVQSDFQKIEVFDTEPFGRMLVHDGVIMLTEFDEAHYHEMIAHVPLNSHPDPVRVLVIGGGDGGTLSEVLRQLERAGAGPYASRAVPQLLMVRRCVSRIDVIVRTGFLPPAYALLEVLIVMIISLMMIFYTLEFLWDDLLTPSKKEV